jgi:hypothetical protein
MATQHIESVVHWFDTAGHRVACGATGYPRSTKHARAVNCPSCVELLREVPGGHTAASSVVADVHAH